MRLTTACLFCCCLAATTSAQVIEYPSEHMRALIEKRQVETQASPTIAQCLQRLVDSDSQFRSGEYDPKSLASPLQAAHWGLLPLLNDSLRTQFLGLSTDSLRDEWSRRYWALRDPTPTTDVNERLVEHENRIRHALEHFGMEEPPYWDDRGVFFVLFGAPAITQRHGADVRQGIGYVPERLSWLYPKEGVLAVFQHHNPPDGPWRFGVSSRSFTSRPDIARDAEMGLSSDLTIFDSDRTQFSELSPMTSANVSLATAAASEVLESHRDRFIMPGYPSRPLWFVFDTDVFLVGDGVSTPTPRLDEDPCMLRLEAHVQFNVEDLTYRWEDSLYAADYRVEGILFDEDLHETARDVYTRRFTARSFDTAQSPELCPGQLDFNVEPGSYRMALRLVDPRSNEQGSCTMRVVVPDCTGRLTLSDIELATTIHPTSNIEDSRFAKGKRLVFPNPIAFYDGSHPLTAYFEIYGLHMDEQGTGRYRISYQIVGIQSGSRDRRASDAPRAFVTSFFISLSAVSDPVEELRIDIGHLREANYELAVRVVDLVGGGEATARTSFSVLPLPEPQGD